jgi:hypothetical protein
MFVRLLVVLIYNILYCFSVLVCCRSLVQIGVQMGEIEQKWKIGPYQCDRSHLVRSSAYAVEHISYVRMHSSSAREVRVALAAIANLLAPWDFRAVICVRTQRLRSNVVRANA